MTEAMYSGLQAAENRMRQAEQRVARLAEARGAIEGLSGHGEAADGRVQADWTSRDGLTSLEFDPRAMKMSSQDLADAVKEAINAASTDLAARARQAMLDSGALDQHTLDHPDPDRAQRFVAQQRAQMSAVMRPAADQIAAAVEARRRLRD